jgi:hypothetical protein
MFSDRLYPHEPLLFVISSACRSFAAAQLKKVGALAAQYPHVDLSRYEAHFGAQLRSIRV